MLCLTGNSASNHHAFNGLYNTDGLRNAWLETAGKEICKDGMTYMSVNARDLGFRRNVVPFVETHAMNVDAPEAVLFLDWFLDPGVQVETQLFSAQAGACFMLERSIIRVGKGKMHEMDYAARRGQFWERLVAERNCMDRTDLAKQLVDEGLTISESEHKALLAAVPTSEISPNFDLFADATPNSCIIATDAA